MPYRRRIASIGDHIAMFYEIYRFFDGVQEFMNACEQPTGAIDYDSGVFASDDQKIYTNRLRMLLEEVVETQEKGFGKKDIVEVADGLIDIIYVAVGGLLEVGNKFSNTPYHYERYVAQTIGWTEESLRYQLEHLRFVLHGAYEDAKAGIDEYNSNRLERLCLSALVFAMRACKNLDLEVMPLFDEVQGSNMSKVTPLIKDEHGKVLKPEGYYRPNLVPLIWRD